MPQHTATTGIPVTNGTQRGTEELGASLATQKTAVPDPATAGLACPCWLLGYFA